MKLKAKPAIAIFIILLLVIDQVVKILVKTSMTINQGYVVFRDWFFIRFIENSGAAYGMQIGGDYGKLALSLFRIVAIILLIIYINRLAKKGTTTGMLVGCSMIIAGAIGNMVDSAFYGIIFTESTYTDVASFTLSGGGYASFLHGKVVDMLYFPIINTTYPSWFPWVGGEPFEFFGPIFNIADSYITTGVIYLLLFQRKVLIK